MNAWAPASVSPSRQMLSCHVGPFQRRALFLRAARSDLGTEAISPVQFASSGGKTRSMLTAIPSVARRLGPGYQEWFDLGLFISRFTASGNVFQFRGSNNRSTSSFST